jgi:general secretion pathway protein D
MNRCARGARLLLLSVCCVGWATAGEAARDAEAPEIRFRYSRAPLAKVVDDVARLTGGRFVFDPDLKGRFTAIVTRKVTRSEALALLEAMLVMQGFAMMRGPEEEWQVLPISVASSGAPWKGPVLDADRSGLITTMIDLAKADAADIARRISHLVSRQDSVVVYPQSNSLILTGSERRVRRIIELARALDKGGLPKLSIRTLRHRDVFEAAELLEAFLAPSEGAEAEAKVDPLQFWPNERTHSLILYGSAKQVARARDFLDAMDVSPDPRGTVRVIRLYHRDAADLGHHLLKLAIGRQLVASGRAGPDKGLLGAPYAIVPDLPTNSLIVDADRETLAAILGMIEKLDRPQPRIQVDVIAYEVTNPVDKSLGIDWFIPVHEPDGPGETSFTIASNPGGSLARSEIGPDLSFFGRASRTPFVLPFLDDSGNLTDVVLPQETVVISANDRGVNTRVLLRPRLKMVSGEEQELFVGENVPIPIAKAGELSGTQTSTQIERQDVGLNLRVKPQLGESGEIELDLQLEISRLGTSTAGSVDIVGPTIESRSSPSKIFLSDGELAVIGLSQEGRRTAADTGVPFLQAIPVLGTFFRSRSAGAVDRHIVFAVQVRILRTHADDLAESIRQRLAVDRSQSRLSGLERNPDEPYAILIATRTGKDDAEAIAASFEREGLKTQVGRWEQSGEERFDVYLSGYGDLVLAGADALQLRERGWEPEVVVLPGATAVATQPPLRTLGSRLWEPFPGQIEAP